ncbi:MAG: porin, partial [Candidatus Gastranaerophilales bacterium]|nr:porin [Candidatus Gastranaerophilales bacterium]
LDLVNRSQISRNFGNKRDLGVKIANNAKYFDYYLGLFNGNGENATESNNKTMDCGGWFDVKPLANIDGYGDLKLGGGYYNGRTGTGVNHNNLGAFLDYGIGKYGFRAEWAGNDGYGSKGESARGWYVHNTYDLTDNFELVARYDQFDPNTDIKANKISEYTLGTNYYLTKNLKFQLNYTFVASQAGKDSNRFALLTQLAY